MSDVREKPSGLQVSFFKAVEVLELHDQELDAAIDILGQALSDRQRTEMGDRVDAYRLRRHHAQEVELRRLEREQAAHDRGGCARPKCPNCGRYKERPSSVCEYCGHDEVTNAGASPDESDRREYDRAVWGQ